MSKEMKNNELKEEDLEKVTGGVSQRPSCSTCNLFVPINSNGVRVSSNCQKHNVEAGTCQAYVNAGLLPFMH